MLEEVFMKSGGPSINSQCLTHKVTARGHRGGRPSPLCLQGSPTSQTSRMAVLPAALLRAAPGLGPPRNSDLFGEVIE